MAASTDGSEDLAWEDLPVPAKGRRRASQRTPPSRRTRVLSPPRRHLGNTGAAKGLRAHTKGACCYCTPYMTRRRYQRALVAREARDAHQLYAFCSAPLEIASFWDSTPDSMEAASSLGSSMEGSEAGHLAASHQEWPISAELGSLATHAGGMDSVEAQPTWPAQPDMEAADVTREWEGLAFWDLEEAQSSWEVVELEESLCMFSLASSSEADVLDDWTVL